MQLFPFEVLLRLLLDSCPGLYKLCGHSSLCAQVLSAAGLAAKAGLRKKVERHSNGLLLKLKLPVKD